MSTETHGIKINSDNHLAKSGEYSILREHRRTDGSFKSLEELEMEYIQLTDSLIFKMTHGEAVHSEGGLEHVVPTKVVFLDKSARPLAWLINDVWDTLAPDPGSDEVPKKPDFKFLNIDRNQWKDTLDPNKTGALDISRIPDELIEGLRSLYNPKHDGSFDAPNEMDDQVIMIVDEVRATGATLNMAELILKRAFPNSKVFGTHWMGTVGQRGNMVGNADLPVWYRDDSTNAKMTAGRGVSNRSPKPEHPSGHFLSTRFKEPDQRALRLREDFVHLAERLKSGEVPYVPDLARADIHERSEDINGKSLQEVILGRRAVKAADKTR